MCEALIRVVDNVNPNDPIADSKLHKRGDIVLLVTDGWKWGTEELINPSWRIVKFPNIPYEQAENYLEPETDVFGPAQPSRVLRLRKFAFDLDNLTLPAGFRTWLADDTRAESTRAINLTGPQLVTYMKTRALLPDPDVLG